MNYISYFDQTNRDSISSVGVKGAHLGELTQAGFPVPPGFCITVNAYQQTLDKSTRMFDFTENLSKAEPEQLDSIQFFSEMIRGHILTLPMDDMIESEIIHAWEQLGTTESYAVRSSATVEDLPTASFAGQLDTYLHVKGKEQLLNTVKQCWASLFTDRAIIYRAKNGFDHRSVSLSVIVQKMVFPDVSGILFTADPVTGHRKTTSIDAGFGIGEAFVSGIVTPDLYKVRDNQIIYKQISSKDKGIFSKEEGGTEIKEISTELQDTQALSDEKIKELANIGREIEQLFGPEQDIEWCLCGEQFYILQARPITSLYPVPVGRDQQYRIFYSVGHGQMMTDYMRPLGRSVWKTMFPYGKTTNQTESAVLVEAGGRLFMDISEFLYIKQARQKILQNKTKDASLSALKKAILDGGIEKRAPKRGTLRKAFQTYKSMIGFLTKVIPRSLKVIYFENPDLIQTRAKSGYQSVLNKYKDEIAHYSGADRIRYIQKLLGTFFAPKCFGKALTYTYAGFITLSILEKKIEKWLHEKLDPSIHKSPPGNVTSEMGLMVGNIADVVRDLPEVMEYLKTADHDTFYLGLQSVPGRDDFLTSWIQFMEIYGMRGPGEIDITRTRYREAPMTLIPAILGHIQSNDPSEHWERFKRGEQEANEAIDNLLTRLKTLPGGSRKAKKASKLIRIFRNTVGIREFPKYIMTQYFDFFRRVMIGESATFCQQDLLEQVEDIFYLSLDEIIALQEDRLPDVKKLVQSRKEHESRYQKMTTPHVITSDGEIFTPEQSSEHAPPGALIGIPVSAGVAEGYVKVVRCLEEGQLNKGEILVAPYTDPGWTPLFQSAKGLVTEIGGLMTHGSVVAREYGIPTVVSVENATTKLKNGQYIRVDGTNGFVEILRDVGEEEVEVGEGAG
ncbi:phosphoenolpyruvate synthase [Thermoactinomyces sp. DSM 45892]|uniref:phosphoenolpyruvate synthase n=1 Tax=Thermoactinomyces sp. DSM 45892 TaxID=1882753 RepID=UPI000898EF24|nr:phosphoenolpyruvate synthase [Thermoactinomyces sp. DSM 45892]SDY15683.1 phosphoenolpyruvate synthase [Thermoactinomyces sp. DSM 45892]